MDDLLATFEKLIDEYQRLIKASENDRDAYVIMAAHHAINEAARDALDFLIEHNATVTFTDPPHSDAATFDPAALGFEWREDGPQGRNWYPKEQSHDTTTEGH